MSLTPALLERTCGRCSSEMKLITLNYDQKRQIVAESERQRLLGRNPTGESLSQWAKCHFGIQSAPNRSTISRILKNPPPPTTTIGQSRTRIDKRCRNRGGMHCDLERVLYQWVCDRFYDRVNLSHAMIRQKACRIQDLLNQRLSPASSVHLTFCEGWMSRFKSRWKLSTVRSYGESGDADSMVA